MSSHADTIRKFLDDLRGINTYTGASAAKQFMWKNRKLVVEGLAENQRLREALIAMRELASVSLEDPWYAEQAGLDSSAIFKQAREALAGDAE